MYSLVTELIYKITLFINFSENHVGPPCGLVRDCSRKTDGSYADLELNCTSYFTCSRHVYFGHNFCTPGKYWCHHFESPCVTSIEIQSTG